MVFCQHILFRLADRVYFCGRGTVLGRNRSIIINTRERVMVLFSIVPRYRGLNEIFGGCRCRRGSGRNSFLKGLNGVRGTDGGSCIVLEIQRRPLCSVIFHTYVWDFNNVFVLPRRLSTQFQEEIKILCSIPENQPARSYVDFSLFRCFEIKISLSLKRYHNKEKKSKRNDVLVRLYFRV